VLLHQQRVQCSTVHERKYRTGQCSAVKYLYMGPTSFTQTDCPNTLPRGRGRAAPLMELTLADCRASGLLPQRAGQPQPPPMFVSPPSSFPSLSPLWLPGAPLLAVPLPHHLFKRGLGRRRQGPLLCNQPLEDGEQGAPLRCTTLLSSVTRNSTSSWRLKGSAASTSVQNLHNSDSTEARRQTRDKSLDSANAVYVLHTCHSPSLYVPLVPQTGGLCCGARGRGALTATAQRGAYVEEHVGEGQAQQRTHRCGPTWGLCCGKGADTHSRKLRSTLERRVDVVKPLDERRQHVLLGAPRAPQQHVHLPQPLLHVRQEPSPRPLCFPGEEESEGG